MYYVYEYPNGHGGITSDYICDSKYELVAECETMHEAKKLLVDLIIENKRSGKFKGVAK